VPEGSKENTNAEAFGLPTDRFEAAVEALVELRDTGRLLTFLTRRGSVKLVGDIEDFRQEYIARAKDNSIDQEQSKKAQDEIRQLTSVIIRIPNPDSILDYLERVYREDFPPTEDPALREEFRRLLADYSDGAAAAAAGHAALHSAAAHSPGHPDRGGFAGDAEFCGLADLGGRNHADQFHDSSERPAGSAAGSGDGGRSGQFSGDGERDRGYRGAVTSCGRHLTQVGLYPIGVPTRALRNVRALCPPPRPWGPGEFAAGTGHTPDQMTVRPLSATVRR